MIFAYPPKNKMILKNKKSQGISFTVLVGAILALIVLIVLITIFYGKSSAYTKTVNDCESKGGKCVSEDKCGIGKLYICPKEKEVCCLSSCEARGGTCKGDCDKDKKIYFVECENSQVCCSK
ncbi:hypothetical protein CMO93_03275 [Candidatus Woesearchaeota archaeon]|nr:hypothetical protein [Candidatus Woesearchaeota archaeon]|tara:strand:- start:1057 stop:1422 length:366 start_codon:yes stop_codon:yes gene_type:complete